MKDYARKKKNLNNSPYSGGLREDLGNRHFSGGNEVYTSERAPQRLPRKHLEGDQRPEDPAGQDQC